VNLSAYEVIDDYLRSVDDTNHTALAVLALCAVEPDRRRGVLDFVCEGGVGESLGAGCWDETGPETAGHGLARLVESGLGDGVVLGPEVEGDGVALGGDDLVVRCHGGAGEGSSKDGGGEKHYE
jgi:hypothetical protein